MATANAPKGAPRARVDKQKVIDEVWDDARVASFRDKDTPRQAGAALPGDADFYVLRHAYQNMRAHDFERFLELYRAAGRDVSARDGDGRTLAEVIATHRHAAPFVELLTS